MRRLFLWGKTEFICVCQHAIKTVVSRERVATLPLKCTLSSKQPSRNVKRETAAASLLSSINYHLSSNNRLV